MAYESTDHNTAADGSDGKQKEIYNHKQRRRKCLHEIYSGACDGVTTQCGTRILAIERNKRKSEKNRKYINPQFIDFSHNEIYANRENSPVCDTRI